MQIRVSRAVRVLAIVVAGGSCLAGCAGSGERLPRCTGKPLPINALAPTVATATAGRADDAGAGRDPGRSAERSADWSHWHAH